tara:strand:+ start:437 stop:2440 length:2004 start_codon:yes stop_codon:yes gene_type:complete
MLPSLANLSLKDFADVGVGKFEKSKKDGGDKKPYTYKAVKLTTEQRKYLDEHWQSDTWKNDLNSPEIPAPPEGRKKWNQLKNTDGSEWSELQRAKDVARRKFPEAESPSSSSDATLEFEPTPFVPTPFVPPPDAPPGPLTLTMPGDFEELKGLTGDLSFWDVRTRMAAADPQWEYKPTKGADIFAMKVKIRMERLQALFDAYQAKYLAALAAHQAAQQAAEEAHDAQQQAAKDAFDKQQALVKAPGGNMILNPEASKKQLVYALLRLHFQKKGKDGKMRYWSTKTPSGKPQDPPVSKQLNAKRLAWAKAQIEALGDGDRLAFLLSIPYNPPPLELFLKDVDAGPIQPQESVVEDPLAMPEFAGAIKAVGASTEPDGAKIFFYVKAIESKFTEGAISPLPPLDADFYVTDAGKRAAAAAALNAEYSPFLTKLLEFGVDQKQLFGENNVKTYTGGSGRFNRTLRAKASSVQEFAWPDGAEYTLAQAEANMNAVYARLKSLGQSGPETPSFSAFKNESLRKIHSLWRTFVIAPRLPVDVPALRAVTTPQFLPHRLAGIPDDKLLPGMAFLDKAFVSTALVSPNAYWTGPLSTFFNNSTNCCMMSLTIANGTPAIPLFVKKQLSFYPNEEEIVLPPLCQYVYRQTTTTPPSMFGKAVTLYHFDVYPAFAGM